MTAGSSMRIRGEYVKYWSISWALRALCVMVSMGEHVGLTKIIEETIPSILESEPGNRLIGTTHKDKRTVSEPVSEPPILEQEFTRSAHVRTKRFDYEDTHEWPEDDSLEYDFLEEGEKETEEPSLWDAMVQNWPSVAVRLIGALCGLCFLLLVLTCCCSVCCRVCCRSLKDNCVPCGGFLELLTSCYEDPTYKRAKEMAELMGIKLDYKTYMKIRDTYDMESGGPFNPMPV